jgi:ribosomal protein S18 acetylase RimI-like enzyme
MIGLRFEWDRSVGLLVATCLHTHVQVGWLYYNNMSSVCVVEYLEVETEARRRGVATALINELQKDVGKTIMLGTQSINAEGRAFYKATGFVEISRVRLRPESLILERKMKEESGGD